MSIVIQERLRPFSHKPGACCLIPGSDQIVTAYPAFLQIGEHKILLAVSGPVEGFTLEMDLERDRVYVYGKAKEGYYKIQIHAEESKVHVVCVKGSLLKEPICLPLQARSQKGKSLERLFLGSHKAQNWERFDLRLSLSALFALGQKTPADSAFGGTTELLKLPQEKSSLEESLKVLFKGAFKGLLVPRLVDDEHQGFRFTEAPQGDALYLLKEGAQKLRSLFFRQEGEKLFFLPLLAGCFDCGKMTNVQVEGLGLIDFEWSKGFLRQVLIRVNKTMKVAPVFQKEIRSFRVHKKQVLTVGEPMLLEAGRRYLLDRFEK